jgi:PmbA protein
MSKYANFDDLLNHAEDLLAAARRAGADSADAIAVRGLSLSASCRMGKREEIERSEGDDVGLRVFVGKRQAIVSDNRGKREAADELAERAVAMARAAPEDPYCGLADRELLARDWQAPDILDANERNAEALAEAALACEEAGLAAKGITNSGGASASWSLGGMALATSDGFAGSYAGTGFSVSCSLVAGEGTAMERDYDYESRTHLADLPDPASIGRKAAERTLRRLGAKKLTSCQMPVFFEPRAASSLVGHFLGAISGAAIARKTSFLKGDLGKPVFATGIDIFDDPLRKRGLRSRPFDGEGVTTAPMQLAKDGVLQSWLLDTASARELGLSSNGHARRGVSGPPSPGSTNVHLAAGAASPQELMRQAGRAFYVTDLIGQGVNLVSGDYSRGAAGFLVENGEFVHAVSEVTIAGNLRDMFACLIAANDLEFNRAINTPTLMVERMTIAGR